MPTLELLKDGQDPLDLSGSLANLPQSFEKLSNEEKSALMNQLASKFANDPKAMERLASTALSSITTDDFDTVTVQPHPGFVCKTHVLNTKNPNHPIGKVVYINICHASDIPEPTLASEKDIQKALNGDPDATYRVPLSMGQARFDKDNAGRKYLVMDACFHTRAYIRAERDLEYRLYLLELSIEYVEENENVALSREFTMPNVPSKGQIPKRILRLPKPSLISSLTIDKKKNEISLPWECRPSFSVIKGETLVVVIPMPIVDTLSWTLDIEPNSFVLTVQGKQSIVTLPQTVDVDNKGNSAEFYKKSKDLVIRLMIATPSKTRRQYL
ncbi:pre-RNA processing PIH1/Nop17-domain-containing protein [Phycomyces nitens]|nr:pre-RNA processing PIH1/Nop17-domain-containing protein [Phycomyces nitens]